MPIPEQYKNLIELLYAKSEKGHANWGELPDEHAFYVSFGEFSITTRVLYNDNDEPYGVTIGLLNAEGDAIDSFEVFERDARDYLRMIALNDMARRKSRRIDEAIERLTAALGKEGEVGAATTEGGTPSDDDIPF